MRSLMSQEAAQAPQLIADQLVRNRDRCEQLGQRIRELQPRFVYIVGRGSSDHAGVFAKYLIEIEIGTPVTASAPSVTSIYGKQVNLKDALVIAISQSGSSPDILMQTEHAKESGAYCLALVNDLESPLASIVDFVLPLCAGEEKAVAATKSYLATLSAILQLVAYWKQDPGLIKALDTLPDYLALAASAPTQLNLSSIENLKHCVVLGRGFGYAVSREIALKLKEVCSLHAEAFSSAEFLHGPAALVDSNLAIIDITIKDESEKAHCKQIVEMQSRGAQVCHLHQVDGAIHPRIAPLTVLQRFYLDVEYIAVAMGFDPDNPAGLKKITRTV